MTFEEKIDRLTERHEALVESVELLQHQTAETAANIEKLTQRIDRVDTQIERYASLAQLNFDRLTAAMLGLTEFVRSHETRIHNLEH